MLIALSNLYNPLSQSDRDRFPVAHWIICHWLDVQGRRRNFFQTLTLVGLWLSWLWNKSTFHINLSLQALNTSSSACILMKSQCWALNAAQPNSAAVHEFLLC